jgi:hypothetical protein
VKEVDISITEALAAQVDEIVTELDLICARSEAPQLGASVDDRLERWRLRTMEWLEENLGQEYMWEFADKKTGAWADDDGTVQQRHRIWRSYLLSLQLDVTKHSQKYETKHQNALAARIPIISVPNDLTQVRQLLTRVHAVAVQLRHRHADRETIDIKDEYDVQDLLHALLRSRFDDVRAEEVSPSYAGGGSRIDFLLKKGQIGIETKMTNPKLRDRAVGEQLIIDIARYKHHPNCKTLVCFVYDPQHYLTNPAGLVADLSKTHDGLVVEVIVTPAA